LPSAIPAAEARRLVAGCDTATGPGRRDAAVLLVLVRLGLRASEVARLELDDIVWRRGEITIKGKGGHGDVLP
jgi:integrase